MDYGLVSKYVDGNKDAEVLYLEASRKRLEDKLGLDRDPSGARIVEVSPKELPSGVLGMYDTVSGVTYRNKDIPAHQRAYVDAHESAHASGSFREENADSVAIARTGRVLRWEEPLFKEAA